MEDNRSPQRDNKKDDDRRYGAGAGRGANPRFKKRVCRLCQEGVDTIDFKNNDNLIKFVSNKGKILPRRLSGSCAKHQRLVAKVIKKSRAAGFMPYNAR